MSTVSGFNRLLLALGAAAFLLAGPFFVGSQFVHAEDFRVGHHSYRAADLHRHSSSHF